KMRDLILQLSKSSIYSTKPLSGLHKSSPIRLRIGRYPGYFTSTTFSRNSSN
ncbi:ankyrin repeat domain-containing protein, partial [Escherichia coli]|nr:ankyrin repeat domain-containing protein [Escherichia coli]